MKSNARDILTDLSSIREKQENMDNMLSKMKQENELLWRELTNMRKKHKAQEHVIQKVINHYFNHLKKMYILTFIDIECFDYYLVQKISPDFAQAYFHFYNICIILTVLSMI